MNMRPILKTVFMFRWMVTSVSMITSSLSTQPCLNCPNWWEPFVRSLELLQRLCKNPQMWLSLQTQPVPSIWLILFVLLQKQVALGNQGWYFFKLIFSPWRENYFNWHLSPDWIGIISVLKFWKKHVPSVSVTQLADYIAKKDLSQKERPWWWWWGLITLSYITNLLMSNYRKLMKLTHAMDLFHKSDSQRKHSLLANHLRWWRAWHDDFMGQCAHPQACWPQCWCQGPCVGRECTPMSCPMTATCVL